MSRLVAIDEVIRVAENTFPKEDVRKIMWVLCHTPTAYDVEKVVAELKKNKVSNVDLYDENNESWNDDIVSFDTTINIVRKGGVE